MVGRSRRLQHCLFQNLLRGGGFVPRLVTVLSRVTSNGSSSGGDSLLPRTEGGVAGAGAAASAEVGFLSLEAICRSLRGASTAHTAPVLKGFFIFPSRGTRPFPGPGCYLGGPPSAESGEWEGEAHFWHHCGNEQIQNHFLNVLALRPPQLPPWRPQLRQAGCGIYTKPIHVHPSEGT